MTETRTSSELDKFSPEVISSPQDETLAFRFDVTALLEEKIGPDWQATTCEAIITHGSPTIRTGAHHTVREPAGRFGLIVMAGDQLTSLVPGIWELYRGVFRRMMQRALPVGAEPMQTYDKSLYTLEAVSQPPADPSSDVQNRFEAHIDQRYTGVLALDVPATGGGELVIANNSNVSSIAEIDAGATIITHRPGTLVCFSRGRLYPHYTREITDPLARRITVGLNYPVVGETPEATAELFNHALGRGNMTGKETE